MSKKSWKELAFVEQMSAERDFPGAPEISFKYAICCNHRTGSNLLSEALYKTGQAGDPMEYFNQRFLSYYMKAGGMTEFCSARYLEDMKRRRTSSNGVFGFNIKFDQLQMAFRENWQEAVQLIKDNDYVLFLYRKNKLKQAISVYIAQNQDLFNVPADVADDVIAEIVDSVPFDPQRIAGCISAILSIEQSWLQFFKDNDIDFEPLAYEDFVSNYETRIDHILDKLHVPEEKRCIPDKPLKRIANTRNEEFHDKFLDYIHGTGMPGFGW